MPASALWRRLITFALICAGLSVAAPLIAQSSEDDGPRLETIEIIPIIRSEVPPEAAEPEDVSDNTGEDLAQPVGSYGDPMPADAAQLQMNAGNFVAERVSSETATLQKPAPEPEVTAANSSPERYRVQLGAYSTMAAAERARAQFRAALAELLGRRELTITSVRPQQDSLWRVFINAEYQDRESASALCKEVQSIGSNCFVAVRRSN